MATESWLARLVDSALGTLEHWFADDAASVPDARAAPHVWQEHLTGCGVAVVAMAAGVPYRTVRGLMFGRARRRDFSTTYTDLRHGLHHYGVSYQRARRAHRWVDIAAPAVVKLKIPKQTYAHWVLLVEEQGRRHVLDPSERRLVRTDWRAMKPISFMPLATSTMRLRRPSRTR